MGETCVHHHHDYRDRRERSGEKNIPFLKFMFIAFLSSILRKS